MMEPACVCVEPVGTAGMRPQEFPIISLPFLSVFKEKPKYPPSRAQSLSYAMASTDASYLSSIVRLFKNLNFVLLVITYGKVHRHPGVLELAWRVCVSYSSQVPNMHVKLVRVDLGASAAVVKSTLGKPFLSLQVLISVSHLYSSYKWFFLSC